MEFLSFNSKTKNLSLKTGPIPKAKGHEVLVKVAYSGVCGTDLHILEGCFPTKETESFILGHEFVGTIQELGNEVTNFKVGQRVAVDPNHGCHKCSDCHRGCYHFCEEGRITHTLGIFKNGGWATHALVPDFQIHAIPDGVDMLPAALTEPLSCIAHGLDLINPVNVGSKILIIGAGVIGLMWASLLHLHGMRKTVTISAAKPLRKKIAENLGFGYEVCNPEELKGKEFDFIIDCSGSAAAMEEAIPLLRNGGTFCIFGVANPQATIKISPFELYMKEVKILGVKVNPFTFLKGLSLVQAMGDEYLDCKKLGIRVCKLSDYKSALEDLNKAVVTKVIFEFPQ